MRIIKIMGGLGNQMAQYAFAKALEKKFGEEVFLDLSWYEEIKDLKKHPNTTQRDFELNVFNITLKFADEKQVKECINEQKSPLPKFICKVLKKEKYSDNRVFQPDSAEFQQDLLEYRKDAYYIGYFQCEKYFNEIRDILLEEFSPKAAMDEKNLETLDFIKNTNSVSIHIRRGDYVSSPVMSEIYKVCPLEYYKKATEFIAQKHPNPHFFIFSDDIPWVEENLNIDYPSTVINFNRGKNSYFDMELMKNCKHNIIANSTFSWWAAWLNENSEKIVIAPTELFKVTMEGQKDLLPENWIRI